LEEKDNPLVEIPAKKPNNLTDEISSQHRVGIGQRKTCLKPQKT
jgi:hypothetical protein